MKRHGALAPEVAPNDLESPSGASKGKLSLGIPPNIQPYEAKKDAGRPAAKSWGMSKDLLGKAGAIAGAVWLVGVLLGYELLWPVYLVFSAIHPVVSIPPFSWLSGWIFTPLSWIFGWASRGTPMVDQTGALQELRLPTDQVTSYLDHYTQQYGDAALIFASHDGYPQLVNGLLLNGDLGYRDLLDATDENGNTALVYAAAKGYRQCTAALLRSGADPNVANRGRGGRTPLMEAAGGGHRDIVAAIRLSNATIDATDDFGNTALHYAAYHGHLSVVHELLKGSPLRDIKNSYGHTAASYAQSNKHKSIADLLSRAPTKREKALAEQAHDKVKDLGEELDLLPARKNLEEKHVKGGAEDLHERDPQDFAPRIEAGGGITDSERKSLEDQIAKLKRQREEAELKAQRRIVELLERSSTQQKAMDEAERSARLAQLNVTELQLRVQDLESRHHSNELKAMDAKERADRLHEDMQRVQLEADRHKARAEAAERERDLHMEASRRHEDGLKRKNDEFAEHVSRSERQARELGTLREDLRKRDEEARQHKETAARLQLEVQVLATGGAAAPVAVSSAATPPAQPAQPAVAAEAAAAAAAPEGSQPSLSPPAGA